MTTTLDNIHVKSLVCKLHLHGGIQYVFKFENEFGASVIQHEYSYGYHEGLWELAVLDQDGGITYDTPIANDTIGHLNPGEVKELLNKIAAL